MENKPSQYSSINISLVEAAAIAEKLYGITGEIIRLPGELDFNFRINNHKKSYVLKIARPGTDLNALEFQKAILDHLKRKVSDSVYPISLPDISGKFISLTIDRNGIERFVRLFSWIEGRIWSEVLPKSSALLYSLGKLAGKLTSSLKGFTHPHASRQIPWDIARCEWVEDHIELLDENIREITSRFLKTFRSASDKYNGLRKGVIHNDANDNNIIVSDNFINPEVTAIIDYGDSVHTQVINDLAVAITYSVMGKSDPLGAALEVVRGYNRSFPLLEDEIKFLHTLVAMRLIISLTKSAINRLEEPENEYLLVSEKPALDLLKKWGDISSSFAHYRFREACGFTPHPSEDRFRSWASTKRVSLSDLFPSETKTAVRSIDMSIGSSWLGHEKECLDNHLTAFRLTKIREKNPGEWIAGGYMEIRPFYSTPAYKREGNNGREYRNTHLGVDIWTEQGIPVHAAIGGKIASVHNNNGEKDYGPTLIIEHIIPEANLKFFTLYGHLSKSTLDLHKEGDEIQKGDLLGHIGNINENGSWPPHLHFQIILDLLNFEHDFPGATFQCELDSWKSISPDPALLFRELYPGISESANWTGIIRFRKEHLGRSLSLSYNKPLKILRGSGIYLIDDKGRKYLDTVNNVAHVGHENFRVIEAGRKQMALLNTNTRYLHETINEFSKELLSTFPKELSVVHLVNSGSEANELALRMAYTATGSMDIIAVEAGYHGNTNSCIGISSYKFEGKGGSGAPEHTRIVPLPDRFRGLHRGESTGSKYSEYIEEKIKNLRSIGRKPAAFICESIISCGGQIELPDNYLKNVYKSVRNSGGLCIADEVQVGCGRVGETFWGFQLHNVVPDIVTIGKPIGNGHPLAAVVCTREVADAFDNGMEFFNTFGGNPVSCSIGLEVLKVVREEKLQVNAMVTGRYLKEGLKELQTNYPLIGDVRGRGLFLGFELTDSNLNPLPKKTSYLSNRMKELGILTSIDGKENNVIKIKPPVIFSTEHADEFLNRLDQVFNEDYMKV